MKTSIVILNWNGSEMMRRFLPSVLRHSSGTEVVVADNASSDDSLAMLAAEFPRVRTIVLDKNYGFAEGYNRALKNIDSEYTVLLNSDVEVEEGWLTPLEEYMDRHEDVAACQPKILSYAEKTEFEYSGAAGGFVDCHGYPYCRGRLFATVEKDHGQYDSVMDIHWATGACMMVRTRIFYSCGAFDSRFFAHNEEIDLCWRFRLFGYRITCVPQSRVYHVGGGTLPQGNPRKVYLNFRNNLLMLYKNLPDSDLRRVMAIRLVLDYVAVVQSLVKGDLQGARAILRARHDFHAMKKDYVPLRQEIQRRAANGCRLTSPCSVLFRYFIGRKRYFSQL